MTRLRQKLMRLRSLRSGMVILLVLLCLAQWSALQHSVEHPFHTASASCNIYLFCEHTGHGLVADVSHFVIASFSERLFDAFIVQSPELYLPISRARGPPRFTS